MLPYAISPTHEAAMARAHQLRAEAFSGLFRRLFGQRKRAADRSTAPRCGVSAA